MLLEDAPPALAGRAVREGTLLLCRDESHRVRLEVNVLRREFDTEPLRKAWIVPRPPPRARAGSMVDERGLFDNVSAGLPDFEAFASAVEGFLASRG